MRNFDNTETRMRKMARRRASYWQDYTDVHALAQDIEQAGWEEYVKPHVVHEGGRWLNVQRAMNDECCRWIHERTYEKGIYSSGRTLPVQGVDLTPLSNLDPSVEDLVFGLEVLDRLSVAFSGRQKGNRLQETFVAMMLSDSPHIGRGLLTDSKMGRSGNPARKKTIAKLVRQFF